MKNLFLFSLLLLFLACQNKPSETTESQEENAQVEPPQNVNVPPSEEEPDSAPDPDLEAITGIYVGMFEAEKFIESKKPTWANKINITIDKVEGNKIIGHSVVAGNARPFEGTFDPHPNFYDKFLVEASEPGDDQYDGVFSFLVNQKTQEIKGRWVANNSNLAVSERSYTLKKTSWTYDPSLELEEMFLTDLYDTYNDETGLSEFLTEDSESVNASMVELTKADIENMHKGDLEVIRNSIYARHGYTFKNRKMRYVFNYVDWYVPMFTDIRSDLTDLEKKNIELLKRYEQHAERYYDSFGR